MPCEEGGVEPCIYKTRNTKDGWQPPKTRQGKEGSPAAFTQSM